jgi:hypothetical protein
VGRPDGRRPLRRSRHRWVYDIEINRRKIGWSDVDCIDSEQRSEEDLWVTVMNLCVENILSRCIL